MRKIVVDMQNFLFADSVATAFKKSDYEIDVVPVKIHSFSFFSPCPQLLSVSQIANTFPYN